MAGKISRRQMIRTGAVGAAGVTLAPLAARALGGQARGANDRIRVAVAGVNGQGGSHVGGFSGMENVELVYIVDPDKRVLGNRIKQAQDASGGRSNPKGVQDIREVLDDGSIDAITIATPNHWHSLMTIWACQAGKDVYVEKPLSHNVHEGRIAVEAARKYNRIVQHGTQNRSNPGWARVIAAVHSGKLGKLKVARALCYKDGGTGGTTRGSIGFRPIKEPPSELDFNLWLGPAREQPYHENIVHYRWHWFWDFGNGDLGNQGVHEVDIARWGIAGATWPKSVMSFGGRLGYIDQAETASTHVAVMDYGETQLIAEVRGLPSRPLHGVHVGNIFHLEAGMIVGHKFYPEGSRDEAPLPDVEVKLGPGGNPYGNFIAAVRSRKVADLNADVLEGHYSSGLCHLANVSVRLGIKIPFEPRTTVLDHNPDAVDALVRTEKYLGEENGLNLEQMGYTLGRKLVIDPRAETIVGDPEANAMLTRHYRKGFEVPDRIA